MRKIYLSWHAVNNGFVVAANALMLLWKEHNLEFDQILYLLGSELNNVSKKEISAFYDEDNWDTENLFPDEIQKIRNCKEIGEKISKKPDISKQVMDIKGVTDYQSIYDSIVDLFKNKQIYNSNDIELHINVSPGTPQMHVVWLMLNSSGYLPKNTKLWSTQYVRNEDKVILSQVSFQPKTLLNEILKSGYDEKYRVRINPNETKSALRKKTESRIRLFASIPYASILILGERGTGKSTYVRTLIVSLQDSKLPYDELSCGTYSEDLMRAELFGYEKGAFSGAIKSSEGILGKYKNGGVLFLDEIHDLSKPLQRQLVQVLQTGYYYPIGADKPKKAIFKLVTASNLLLSQLTNAERLDADFLDRIARFIVNVPPIRKCQADFEIIWREAWKEIANFEGAPPIIWKESIKKLLIERSLSGNIRDIQKIISHIIAFYIQSRDIDESITEAFYEFDKFNNMRIVPNNVNKYFKENDTYRSIIKKFNRDLILWAKGYYGSLDKASEVLKRTKSMLYKDLK